MIAWLKGLWALWMAYRAGEKRVEEGDKDATAKVSQDVVKAQGDSSVLSIDALRKRLRDPATYRK